MTDLRKAAEQALKVMEEINEISKPPAGIPLPAEIDDAMETLRQALSKPRREWVGLTNAEKHEAFEQIQEASEGFWEFADYLEAKLKEKNT